ncbi:MAG: S1C family serine protease [Actinomycetes bacterium]
MYPTYPTIYDVEPEPVTPPPAPPATRRVIPAVALVLAGVLAGGIAGGVAGAHYGKHDVVTSLGATNAAVAAPGVDPKSYTAIAAKVLPSVVSIQVTTAGGGDTGSGFVIRNDGYLLTNNHVIASALNGGGAITVTFNDGTAVAGSVVGADSSSDLAVVKVQRKNLTPVAFGSSASVQVGDPVLAIGSPLGLQGTVTQGIVSALNRPVHTQDQQQQQNLFNNGSGDSTVISAIQTDAAINPGNSGGPLVDGAGQVIGIDSAIASLGSGNIGVGFAIPIDQARVIAAELISTGHATHPVLGVQIADITTGSGAHEVQLRAVSSGGPAAKAGLRVGDVVVTVNGTNVTSSDGLIAAIRSHKPGDQVSVTYERGGQRHTVNVTLADATSS